MEKVTIIVNARDRFSPTERCLEEIFANTDQPFDLIAVIGGAPEHLKRRWAERFGGKARFIFNPNFLNQAQARNIGMREAKTKLAVLMDNDVFVRAGWLAAMLDCQRDTGAVMVEPVVLETKKRIHTAGNDLYVTYEGDKAYGHKHCRFYGKVLADSSNLKRQPVDYGELHCQLVEIEPTLRLNAFDENLLEAGEVDSGLVWDRAGLKMWFEPKAVVYYNKSAPITVDDIRFFSWRWDLRSVYEGYRYFQKKWNMDITEHGMFGDFLVRYNSQLELIPRLWPNRVALSLDYCVGRLREKAVAFFRAPKTAIQGFRKRQIGYQEWVSNVPSRR